MASLYDSASLVMIPSGVKDGKAYSIKPTDGSGDFTFSRGTGTATRVNASGLIEKERSNQLLQSNTFDTTWATNNASVTGSQSGYDGSSDAWKLIQNTTNTFHFIYQNVSVSSICTYSIYAKAGEYSGISFFFPNVGGTSTATTFNLSTGTFVNNTHNATSEDVGGGWYRISLLSKPSGATNFNIYVNQTTQQSEAGDGTSGIYIQDAQLESGLVATDYIETTTAAVYEGITDNLPRLDYSGGASCPSLLLEPSRTNLISNSEYHGSKAVGGGAGFVVTDNYGISPEGVQNACRIQYTSGNTYMVTNNITISTGDVLTISFWAKGTAGEKIVLYADGSAGAGIFKAITLTEDWVRYDGTTNAATANGVCTPHILVGYGETPAASDFQIYGWQAEAGSYATSYIPTYGTAASRAVDKLYKTGISSLIGQTEGTIFIETTPLDDTTSYTERMIQFEDGGSDLMGIQRFGNSSLTYFGVTSGGTQWSIGASNVFEGGRKTRIAAAYANNDIVLYVDGVQKGTDSSASVPTTDRVFFANNASGSLLYVGEHHQVLFFPTRLSNAELAALTTI
jgi:hypothetical protein